MCLLLFGGIIRLGKVEFCKCVSKIHTRFRYDFLFILLYLRFRNCEISVNKCNLLFGCVLIPDAELSLSNFDIE